jgi:3-phosphoshikimate 1-carboxyvinyltransferase
MAKGTSTLQGALQSEDTEVMIAALRQIGVTIDVLDGGRTLKVDPTARRNCQDDSPVQLFVANSGTTIRFLTAALSAIGGHYRLSGVARMHERPIQDLVSAIGQVIDGQIQSESPQGCPPVAIRSSGWKGREMEVGGSVSSQYLSGLMMAAAMKHHPSSTKSSLLDTRHEPILVRVRGELVSVPYVDMTLQVIRSFGGIAQELETHCELQSEFSHQYEIGGDGYRGTQYDIEPDASAASYFWATAAITGGTVRVEGLTRHSMQGDVGFVDVLAKMGCRVVEDDNSLTVIGRPLSGIDVDMNSISDTVQSLAPVALFASGPTRVRGVAHNRFKETDRIGDLARELRRVGAVIEEHDDGLTIHPLPAELKKSSSHVEQITLKTYHDHRMAMGLSLIGLGRQGVWIEDPACTSKTYPEYFADLETLLGQPHQWAR